MKVKQQAIKELETLRPTELMKVYDLILSFKQTTPEQKVKEETSGYAKVRKALKQYQGSMSEDILSARKDRI